jgi:hypothetical protein
VIVWETILIRSWNSPAPAGATCDGEPVLQGWEGVQGRVLVHGSYQSGIGVVDFTDPTNAVEIAYADPAPLSQTQLILGGDWSSYWYDGRIYESDITRGLIIWNLSDPAVAGALKLGHLNPQTQEFTLD